MTHSPVPTLRHFETVAERYDLILCDVWGVLHDGRRGHVAAPFLRPAPETSMNGA